MNDIERRIQAALRREANADPLAADATLAEEVLTAFRGRYRWLSVLMIAETVAVMIGLAWAGMRFYQADSVSAQLQWGALGFVLFGVMMLLKLWFWLEMHTNRVLRELKRVELLLVSRQP